MTSPRRSTALLSFTLVELLVVIAILAVLMSLLMPSLKSLTYQQERLECNFKLKSIGQILTIYSDDNNDYFPRHGSLRDETVDFGFAASNTNDDDEQRLLEGAIIKLLQPYSNTLAKTFFCSELQEVSLWDSFNQNLNYDENDRKGRFGGGLPAGYQLYFNSTSLGRFTKIMEKQGDTFSFATNGYWNWPNLNGEPHFDLLASDYTFDKGGGGVHSPPDYPKIEKKEPGQHPNYSYWSKSAVWDSHFLSMDGSTKSSKAVLGERSVNVYLVTPANTSKQPWIPMEFSLHW